MIQIETNFGISKAGYLHIPFLYFSCGHDGFIIGLPIINVLVTWGNAAKANKQEKQSKSGIDKYDTLTKIFDQLSITE